VATVERRHVLAPVDQVDDPGIVLAEQELAVRDEVGVDALAMLGAQSWIGHDHQDLDHRSLPTELREAADGLQVAGLAQAVHVVQDLLKTHGRSRITGAWDGRDGVCGRTVPFRDAGPMTRP